MLNSFGGGMVPFDQAYHEVLKEGGSPAQGQAAGAYALLHFYMYEVEKRLNG